MYTPPFALAGAAAWQALGPAFLPALRLANLAGACVLALAALVGSPWPRGWRLAAAVAAVCSPLVADGLQCGNISLLLLGIVVGALAVAPAHPWLAGAAIGLVTASKPVAVSALAVLATPDRGAGWPRARLRTVLGAGVAGASWLLLGAELLPSMLSRAGGLPSALTNVSLPRVLYAFGAPVHPAVTFALVTALGAAWAWWRRPSPRPRVAIAASTSLLALPIANPSTLVYSLPAQVLAVERAIAGFRTAGRHGGRRRALAELALVIAAVLSVNGALGVAATGSLPLVAQGFVTLMPLAAVAGLTVYGSGGVRPDP
jgi:hypothetical protein